LRSDFVNRGDFEDLFLATLEPLASDPIVDVRLALARLIRQHSSSAILQLPPHPLLMQIYRTLRSDASGMVREALGDHLDAHLPSTTNGHRADSLASHAAASYSHEDDELMSDSALSSSTITDLRSLGSNDAFDLLRHDDRASLSPAPETPPQRLHPPIVKRSSYSSGRDLYTREHEGFVAVERLQTPM
jgi:hypothetical protein